MQVIETMPTYLGGQLYPYGNPIPAHQTKVNGLSVQTIFLRNAKNPNKEDEEILRQYMLYHFLAPCFDLMESDRQKAKDLSYDDLFDLCLNNGIDPL